MQALDWDDLRFLLAAARGGSFAAAARALRVDQATVGRRLRALQDAAGTPLWERTPGRLALTAAGRRAARAAAAMDEAALQLERTLDAGLPAVEGTLRIGATEAIAAEILAPRLPELRARHPALRVELAASNHVANLARREADLAVRLFRPAEGALAARRAGVLAFGLYASEGYLRAHGRPRDAHLAGHALLGYERALAARSEALGWADELEGTVVLRASSAFALRAAAVAGLGVGLLPCLLADRTAGLARVVDELRTREIWLTVHGQARGSARARAGMALDSVSEAGEIKLGPRARGDGVPGPRAGGGGAAAPRRGRTGRRAGGRARGRRRAPTHPGPLGRAPGAAQPWVMRAAGARHPLDELRSWFTDRAWRVGPDAPRGLRRALAAVSRVGYATVRGFLENRLTLRAAALTYFSVLSIVPLLAFAFAVLKGLGAYAGFVQQTLMPYLARTFGENTALLTAVQQVFRFVDRTNVSTLGVVGLLTLVYTSVSLLSNVEASFNVVWGARTQRPFVRQVTDYVTLLVTTPILIVVATTFATAAQSSQAIHFLRDTLQLGPVIDFALRFTSVVVVATALFALYVILPNVHVRPASALIGAAVSALLWQAVLVLHVRFQVGIAGYNALYSVLGALPIFLVWMYFSWVTVLVGAQVAASHQHGRALGDRFVQRRVDQALRERLAIALAAVVTRDFRAGTRRAEAELAELVQLPRAPVDEVLGALVQAGILARAVAGRDTYLLPGRDPAIVRVLDVRDALRREPEADAARPELAAHLPAPLRDVLDGLEQELRRSPRNVTLVELSELVARPGPAQVPAPARAPGPAGSAPPLADDP